MKYSHTFKGGNTITLEQSLHTLCKIGDNFIFLGYHQRYVRCNALNLYADITQVITGINKLVGSPQAALWKEYSQRSGRYLRRRVHSPY